MLHISELAVAYGKVEAVRDVSLDVAPGAVTLVLGPNGAGKTSTARAVCGLVEKLRGRVSIDDVDVTADPPHRIVGRGLVMVPEGRRVFASLTVEENLLIGGYTVSPAVRRERLEATFDLFPILRDRRRGAAGLLSGGEQQMLAFGRALMSGPRYVLLDEPSMGLSPALVEQVFDRVRAIADAGSGVLMIEQNADAALDVADDVVVVSRGVVAYRNSAEAARSDTAVMRAFLGEAALA